jgi:hypothetical protein
VHEANVLIADNSKKSRLSNFFALGDIETLGKGEGSTYTRKGGLLLEAPKNVETATVTVRGTPTGSVLASATKLGPVKERKSASKS